MNKILEETLAQHKADPNFEQRMLAGFRNRAPQRTGLLKLLADLMRMRAAQVTAVAAVLLGLMQLGRMITLESATPLTARDRYVNKGFEQPSRVGGTSLPGWAVALDKSDDLAAGERKDLALRAPPAAAETRSNVEQDFKAAPATGAPAETAQADMAPPPPVIQPEFVEERTARESANDAVPMKSAAEASSPEKPAAAGTNSKLSRKATE